MLNIVAHVCFWVIFTTGAVTTAYGVGKIGYGAYKKIKDTFTQRKLNKAMKQ